MTFYRVQKKDGTGVYRGSGNACSFMGEYEDFLRHPTPCLDSLLERNFDLEEGEYVSSSKKIKQYIFGFSSIEQFHSWFYNDEIKRGLEERGYSLYKVNSKRLIEGHCQALMKKSAFKKLKKTEIRLTSI